MFLYGLPSVIFCPWKETHAQNSTSSRWGGPATVPMATALRSAATLYGMSTGRQEPGLGSRPTCSHSLLQPHPPYRPINPTSRIPARKNRNLEVPAHRPSPPNHWTSSCDLPSARIPPTFCVALDCSIDARDALAATIMAATPDPQFPCSITLDIPLPTLRLATSALKALQVDPELSQLVTREFSVVPAPESPDDDARVLKVKYKATTNRMLRVAVNSFMDSLKLVLEVMEQLDTDVLGQSQEAGQSN
ncbi:hypothetical protein AUP68_12671 [Ilyonectria robusta]